MNSAFVPFADLKLGRLDQQIVGRILRYWPERNVKKGGQLMGVDFLLIDEKSTVMQGSIYITHLHKFEDALRDGAIYTISAFNVTRSNTRFKLSDFHFSIRFTAATLFVEAEEYLCLIPKEFFRIKTHEELLRLANTNMELPDVMGEIVSTKVYRNGMSETLERMLVHMRLESGEKVRLSAFDDHATSLDKFFSKKEEGTFILLATNINPKIFGGELYLNATSGTKFYGDGDCTTTQQFAERLKGRDKDGTNSIAPYHGVEKIEHVSIEELNQFLATANPEEAEFLCTATVTDIQTQHGWSFISCGECGTKMVKKEASLACNNYKCGSTSAIGDVKYRVELVVNDGMSNGVFVAFDKDMVKLTNIQATTLTSQMVDTHQNSESEASVPKVVSDIIGKKFTFQIKLSSFNFTPHHQSFTISRIFETSEEAPGPNFREAGGSMVLTAQTPTTSPTHLALKNTPSAGNKTSKDPSNASGEDVEVTASPSEDMGKQKKQKCN